MRSVGRGLVGVAVVLATVVVASNAAHAASIRATDDAGHVVTLARPASRVVTLAPSLTELVFTAGGEAALVGTTALSDFPEAARRVDRIGDASRLDVERVLALKPDLVLVWQRGNLGREIEQIGAAGIALFQLEPRRLDDVPRAVERLGVLLGHEAPALGRANALRSQLEALRSAHAGAAPVRVFYQVWQSPLMTVSRSQMIGDAIALCGGRNVFGELVPLVPVVSTEAVVAADPEAIFTASEKGGGAPAWQRAPDAPGFAAWHRYTPLTAARRGWMFTVNGDLISRQGPRIVEGVAAICAALDTVRRERATR